MRAPHHLPTFMLGLVFLGCGTDAGDFTNPMPEPQEPPWSCGDESGTTGCETSTGTGEAQASSETGPWNGEGECMSSEDCQSGVCIADFLDRERGPFACVSTCIGLMDEAHWCADDAACCDPNATCSSRGYCLPPG